jgi:hypothetical protein
VDNLISNLIHELNGPNQNKHIITSIFKLFNCIFSIFQEKNQDDNEFLQNLCQYDDFIKATLE